MELPREENEDLFEQKVEIESIKEQFVPAEFSLLLKWSLILESQLKGTCWVYLQLQIGINRDVTSELFGKSYISMGTLADRCGATRKWVSERIKLLIQYKFIKTRRSSGSFNTIYTIVPLPDADKQLLLQNEKINEELIDIKNNPPEKKTTTITTVFKSKTDISSEVPNEVINAGLDIEKYRFKKVIEKHEMLCEKDFGEWTQYDYAHYFLCLYELKYKIQYGHDNKIIAAERILLNKLVSGLGPEVTIAYLDYCVENWESFSIVGYPTIRLIYSLRTQKLPLVRLGTPSTEKITGRKDMMGI